LKLAGEVQPVFREYWEQQVAPHIDGRQIEYVGEADPTLKNSLLSRARALLFPIQWEEPFGLVMIESMACGTPVLAFAGGAVEEIVRDGINGWTCSDVNDMAERIAAPLPASASCRDSVAREFSLDHMIDAYLAIYERIVPTERRQDVDDRRVDGRRELHTTLESIRPSITRRGVRTGGAIAGASASAAAK
jgi:glycosyltransferase involved in cell wall biosynthesis